MAVVRHADDADYYLPNMLWPETEGVQEIEVGSKRYLVRISFYRSIDYDVFCRNSVRAHYRKISKEQLGDPDTYVDVIVAELNRMADTGVYVDVESWLCITNRLGTELSKHVMGDYFLRGIMSRFEPTARIAGFMPDGDVYAIIDEHRPRPGAFGDIFEIMKLAL